MKKFWLLFALLIGPLIFYLLVLLIKVDVRFLPILNEKVTNVTTLIPNQETTFINHINIVGFLGDDILLKKTNALNLNEKIYKRYYKFKTFQFVMILPIGTEEKVEKLKKELGFTTDISKWKFVFTTKEKINLIYNSLKSTKELDATAYSSEVFILDRNGFQRGRDDDEDTSDGMLYSYNSESVSFLHHKMVDDLKALLEEYRRALKRNKKKEVFTNPYKEEKK